MHKSQKTTNAAKGKKAAFKKSTKKPALACPNSLIARHLKIASHSHTGKLIHHRQTSHLLLFLMLVLLGLFLYASGDYAKSTTNSDSVMVGAIVTGPAPTIGVQITSPLDGTKINDNPLVDVKGICQAGLYVIVRNNGAMAGSTTCSEAGVFSLQIQLSTGKNELSALNYDNLNQPGPATASIAVYLIKNGVQILATGPTVATPVNPTTITGLNNFSDCSSYNAGSLPVDDQPHITVACMPRLFLPNLPQLVGVLAWGGTPPYAVSIDLGNNSSSDLLSLPSAGYRTLNLNYSVPDTYKVAFKLKDQTGKTATIQTSVQVSGEKSVATQSTVVNNTTGTLAGSVVDSISKAPTPLYLVAMAVTIGFWGGDLYDRKYGAGKRPTRRRKST